MLSPCAQALVAPTRRGSALVLAAERVVLAAQIAVAAVEEPQNGRNVRWPVDAMADTLGHRIGWFRIAVLDELVTLRVGDAQLRHPTLTIEDPELQMLVTHDRGTLRQSLDTHTGPAGKLAGDLIDERGSTWHQRIVPARTTGSVDRL